MIPWFEYTVWHIGPIPIQVWGFFVALGMLLGVGIIWKKGEQVGVSRELALDMSLWALIGGFVGGRLFHVLFYNFNFFLTHPLEIFQVWHGGMSSFGGLFGAMVGVLLFIQRKKILKEVSLKIIDLLGFGALYGWMLGRVGCVMIHDHLGITCPNCVLAIKMPTGPARLDMAIIEIIALIPLAIWFFVARKKPKPTGWYTSMLFIYYGAIRFVLDFFRARDIIQADVRYVGLTPAQYFAIVLILLGIGWLIRKK